VHGALAARVDTDDTVVVLGTGTLGLLTLAALRQFTPAGAVVAVAKHPVQRELALALGATTVVEPAELKRAVRRSTGSLALGDGHIDRLTGGADVVIDCVGSETSLADSLAVVRPGGRITMVGMPGHVHVDLTGLWQRRRSLAGAYAYGTEVVADPTGNAAHPPGPHVRPRFELVEAADLAASSAPPIPRPLHRRGGPRRRRPAAVKIAFDLRDEKSAPVPRPGFVLDVDRSTPPVLFHHGEQFKLEKLPPGRSRIVYPGEPLEPLDDIDGAIHDAPS
jgi:hypothetical protein